MTKLKPEQDYQVAPEPEAQTTPAKIYSIAEQKSNYRKNYIEYDYLGRTNKPKYSSRITAYLSSKAKDVLGVVVQKLKGDRKVFVANHKYLEAITNRCRRQNVNILKELRDYFDIEFHQKYEHEGKVYRNCYVFQNIECGKKISPSKTHVALEEQSVEGIPYKNNNIKNIRSNAQAHESKFLGNSNSSNSLSEQVEATQADTTTCENVDSLVKAVSKKRFKSNLRKKPTTAERKASKARVYQFNQYDKPKTLADHYPLSQEDCWELQKCSGKAYSQNAMNEILLSMSRKPKESKHTFESKARFMSYMTKAYKNEGRDVDLVNNPTFKIMAGRTQAEVVEILTLNQRESYMKKQEDAAIFNRSDYTQFRARIAGQFPINLGYDLLTNMISVKKEDSVFEMTMHKAVELTEHYKQLLLSHAKGIGGYAGVDKLEVII